MKVGDLVMRHIGKGTLSCDRKSAEEARERLGVGIVIDKFTREGFRCPILTVFYPKTNKTYEVGEFFVEIANENR